MRSTYSGPKQQIQPSELQRYERTGFAAEEKIDGFWCEVTTDRTGKIAKFTGRSGKPFDGVHTQGLIGLQTSLIDTVLIAELEAGTEAANRRNDRLGHRRLFVFDVVKLLGEDTRRLPYENRRELLELAFASALAGSRKLLLVCRVTSNFEAFFRDVVAKGGEGVVLKRLGRTYVAGKHDGWIRCKQFRYVDYVVMSIGRSEGGSPNFQVGLFYHGALRRVGTIKDIPRGLDYESLVGKVIECKGAELHSSGALRHGHFERVRDDKEPSECVLFPYGG